MSMLLDITVMFSRLSLLAVGGVNSTLPAIAHEVIDERHWMSAKEFSQLFAIAQAAPGPNMMIVALIGQHEDGLVGGLVALAATVLPAALLILLVSSLWQRFQQARWRIMLQTALIPVTGGLMISAGIVVMRVADSNLMLAAMTAVAVFLTLRTRLHPLWLLGGGAVLGVLLL